MLTNLLANYAVDVVEPYVKWISISLAAIVLIAVVILYFVNNDVFKQVFKVATFVLVVYALVVTIFMLILDIAKHYNSAYLDKNYVSKDVIYYVLIPVAATLFLSLVSLVAIYVLKTKNYAKTKTLTKICLCVCGAMLLASLVTIFIYYARHIEGDGYYTAKGTNFNQIALYASAILLIAVEIAIVFVIDKRHTPLNTNEIARAGICLALAYALSYVKLFSNPQGGSMTLASMLPLMLFSYFYGTRKGVFLGLIYGLLQSLQNPYIIHPAQFLLDYPIAFSMIGLAGTFKNLKNLPHAVRFGLGGVLAGVMRFLSSFLSGVFAFGAYAPTGQSVWVYSLLYNSVILLDAALAVAIGILLNYNKNFRKLF